jgi:hypothetical protein
MGKLLGWAFMVVMACSGVAYAGGGHERWESVEGLAPDARIEVLPQNQAGPDACRLVSVDDGALTCIAGNNARLVYPRGAVRDVWVIEQAPERHIGRWIAVGAGAGLVALASAKNGVAGGVVMGGIVILVAAVSLNTPRMAGYPYPGVRSPPQQRMRRRLVYRSGTP